MPEENIIPQKTISGGNKTFATIISYIFHPVFLPLMMVLVIYFFNKPGFIALQNKMPFWLIAVIINTILFPLLATLLLKKLNFISSIKMEEPKDRIIPLIATMTFYFWAYEVFKNIDAPFLLRILLLGNFWGVIAVFMINIFFKISMHTAAAGSAIGIILLMALLSPGNMLIPLIATLVIAGIIGTARMILGAHIAFEIWLGYFVGIISQLAAYLFLK